MYIGLVTVVMTYCPYCRAVSFVVVCAKGCDLILKVFLMEGLFCADAAVIDCCTGINAAFRSMVRADHRLPTTPIETIRETTAR